MKNSIIKLIKTIDQILKARWEKCTENESLLLLFLIKLISFSDIYMKNIFLILKPSIISFKYMCMTYI